MRVKLPLLRNQSKNDGAPPTAAAVNVRFRVVDEGLDPRRYHYAFAVKRVKGGYKVSHVLDFG